MNVFWMQFLIILLCVNITNYLFWLNTNFKHRFARVFTGFNSKSMDSFLWVIVIAWYLPVYHSYRAGPTQALSSYDDGNQYCIDNFNSSLATIYTPEQNVEAMRVCIEAGEGTSALGCLIGLRYDGFEWEWQDNTILSSFYYWGHGEPNGNNEDCVEIVLDGYLSINTEQVFKGEWNDLICNGFSDRLTLCNEPPQGT